MLTFDNGGRLVQSLDELPSIESCENLFLDFETTSHDETLKSLNPWFNCWVAGLAITWDSTPGAWYVALDHADKMCNLPREAVIEWLRDVISKSKRWVNHHVKYDTTVMYNDLGIDVLQFDIELVCTIVRAKILDSDRIYKGGYGLDALSLSWLHEDISPYEAAMKPYLEDNKDYGRIATDICGEYACQDVLSNRRLMNYLTANIPEESAGVVDTETKLTKILVDMEREGLKVRPMELKISKLMCLTEMVEIEKRLHDRIGYRFSPVSNKDCYDVLCNHFGLPVLSWTEPDDGKLGNPSFDVDALNQYRVRIDAPKDVVDDILRYRKLSNLKGLFIETFEEFGIDDGDGYATMHPEHNQSVRTGRMSVKRPNSQQQNDESKSLIVPGEGMAFFSSDASQIEFRTIGHFTQDPDIIKAYAENPDVDFHAFVGEMCGIKRRPAKTLNFSVAFGQGKKHTVEQLATNEDIVASLLEQVEELVRTGELLETGRDVAFKSLARQRGEAVYDTYHETFPYIKTTAKMAARVCRQRGWVKNVCGRRRHLPEEHSNKAFNSLNQSSAADIIKQRMVALYQELKGTPIRMLTQVHDEILLCGPREVMEDERTQHDIVDILEDVHFLRVPIRFKYGVSAENWAKAKGDLSMPLEKRGKGGKLAHLKGL